MSSLTRARAAAPLVRRFCRRKLCADASGPCPTTLRDVLERVALGSLTVEDALDEADSIAGFERIERFAKLDHSRMQRTGFPEVVYGKGKTPAQIGTILAALSERADVAMATLVDPDVYAAVRSGAGPALRELRYDECARIAFVDRRRASEKDVAKGVVTVACAGTADLPVAEEAAVTASLSGYEVERVYDVGVAGLPRLLASLETLRRARVIVCCAGMEGALPSVLAGLVEAPVVAVPTSAGYGSAMGGLTAMAAMLSSCAPGVAVCNVDNGFGGAAMAIKILRSAAAVGPRADGENLGAG